MDLDKAWGHCYFALINAPSDNKSYLVEMINLGRVFEDNASNNDVKIDVGGGDTMVEDFIQTRAKTQKAFECYKIVSDKNYRKVCRDIAKFYRYGGADDDNGNSVKYHNEALKQYAKVVTKDIPDAKEDLKDFIPERNYMKTAPLTKEEILAVADLMTGNDFLGEFILAACDGLNLKDLNDIAVKLREVAEQTNLTQISTGCFPCASKEPTSLDVVADSFAKKLKPFLLDMGFSEEKLLGKKFDFYFDGEGHLICDFEYEGNKTKKLTAIAPQDQEEETPLQQAVRKVCDKGVEVDQEENKFRLTFKQKSFEAIYKPAAAVEVRSGDDLRVTNSLTRGVSSASH